MYTDVIWYRLAEEKCHDDLIAAADDVFETWMRHQPGFICWQINLVKYGAYCDVVQWQDEASAKAAEKSMSETLSMDNAWFSCYDMTSIKTEKILEQKKYS
jgi:hypothetical protein